MEESKKSSCEFEGKTYSDGEQMCVADKCMQCDDGIWRVNDIRESGGED